MDEDYKKNMDEVIEGMEWHVWISRLRIGKIMYGDRKGTYTAEPMDPRRNGLVYWDKMKDFDTLEEAYNYLVEIRK